MGKRRHLQGIEVTLYEKVKIGVDGFNRAEYEERPVAVSNVLIAPVGASETLDTLNLTGKKAVYSLGIPKGDTHNWKNVRVDFFGQSFRTFGEPVMGIDDLIPLDWNMKVMVEKYGQ